MTFLALFLGIFLLFGIGLFLSAVQRSRLARFGTRTTGEVLHVEADPGDSESGPTTRVDYAYFVGERRVQARDDLSGDYRCCLQSPLQVLYLNRRRRPLSMIIPSGETAGSLVRGHWIFALIWNAILSPFLWLATIPLRMRRLVRHGQPVTGRVRSIQPTTNDKGRPSGATVEYEFYPLCEGSDGPALVSGRGSATLDQAANLHLNDPLTILYSPAKLRRNVAYQLSAYEVVLP